MRSRKSETRRRKSNKKYVSKVANVQLQRIWVIFKCLEDKALQRQSYWLSLIIEWGLFLKEMTLPHFWAALGLRLELSRIPGLQRKPWREESRTSHNGCLSQPRQCTLIGAQRTVNSSSGGNQKYSQRLGWWYHEYLILFGS